MMSFPVSNTSCRHDSRPTTTLLLVYDKVLVLQLLIDISVEIKLK